MRLIIGLLGAKGAGKDTCAGFLLEQEDFTRIGFADALYREVANSYGVSVEFLGRRETKEVPLPELRLAACSDLRFVATALAQLTRSSTVRRDALQYLATGRLPQGASRRRVLPLLNAPRSPRWTLQLWGTEFRRLGRWGLDSYWLDKVRAAILAAPERNFIVTDVRFKNEAQFVRELGGVLCRIRRPELEAREEADRARRGSAAHPSETEMLGYPVDAELFNLEGDPESLRATAVALLDGLREETQPRQRKAA